MSQAIRSMQVWTVYIFVLGVGLLLVPNLVIGLFGIAETTEVWIRVVGLAVLALGVLYWSMTQRGDREGFLATAYERWFVAAVLTVLAFTTGPWQLVLFGVVEFIGATWTFLSLRDSSDKTGEPHPVEQSPG